MVDYKIFVYMLNHFDKIGQETTATEVMDLLVRVLNKAVAIEREPIDIGHGILLHASEVHLIDMAGRYPNEGVSKIARRLGITKGAVSQTAKKLEAKGYIERVNNEGDKKTILLKLTLLGHEAYTWHSQYHQKVNESLMVELSKLSTYDRSHLIKILRQLESMLEHSPKVRIDITKQFRTSSNRLSS